MSARANTARNAFHRSLNPWLRPQPSGPINKNQQPKRKTGINTTLDRFHKMIVDLNQQNAKLIEVIENMEKIQGQNISAEEEDIVNKNTTEEEKKRLITEFQTSISNHRKSLEKRLKKLNEIEEDLGIFRFDDPQPQPPKVEFPPVNPNIPSPRAHLRTSPRFDLANSIAKAENDQLTAKALYLERMIVVQKMKLKLCHDHRELAKLAKELSNIQSSIQSDTASDFNKTQPSPPLSSSQRSLKSPRSKINKNNLKNTEDNSNASSNPEPEEDDIDTEFVSVSWVNPNDENANNDNQNNIDGNDDDDGDSFEEIEDQKLKDSITILKAAIEHEKLRIKQYKSKFHPFYEAASKIQKVWRGYNYRLSMKNQEEKNEN